MSTEITKFEASCTTIAVATKKGTTERTLLGVIMSTSKAAKQAGSKHLAEKWWSNGQFAPLVRECTNVFGSLFTDFVTHPAIAMDLTTGRVANPHMTNRAAWSSVFAGLNAKDVALNKKGAPAPFKGEKRMLLDALNHAVLVGEMNMAIAAAAAQAEFDAAVAAATTFEAVEATALAIEDGSATAPVDALSGASLDAAIAAELAALDSEALAADISADAAEAAEVASVLA